MTEDLIRIGNNLAADAENVLIVKDDSYIGSPLDANILHMTLKYVLSSDNSIWDVKPESMSMPSRGLCDGIDILIPCYMHSAHILNVVQSVLNQDFKNVSVHVLLMDEKSISLKEKLESKDSKVHCYAHEVLKPAKARNWLIDKGSYSHVLFLDADDPLTNTHILSSFLEYSEYDVVMPLWPNAAEASFYNMIYCSQTTALLKRSLLETMQFDESFVHGCEDADFFIRAYLQGASIKYSSAPFERSGFLCETYLSHTKYGSYDLMYKHREHFLPILKEALVQDVDERIKKRTRLTISLLESDEPKEYANMYELSFTRTQAAACLMGSLPSTHARKRAYFLGIGEPER